MAARRRSRRLPAVLVLAVLTALLATAAPAPASPSAVAGAPPAERFLRWVRRHPLIAGLTGSLTTAILVGLVAVGWQWRRAEKQSIAAKNAGLR